LWELLLKEFGIPPTGLSQKRADWVKPETITGTRVGFEDPILGFGAGGVTAVIYEEAFKHRVYKRLRKKTNHFLAFIMPWLLFWAVALITFWFLNFHSFSANMLGLITALVYIYVLRPDLIPDSLVTGLLVVLLSTPVYLLIFALFPGFKEAYWQWGKLSGLELAGIPIEDLLWLMGIGAFAGPFYEFWQGLRIVEKK
jgi:hypothetical protein